MANKKISQLTLVDNLNGTELLPAAKDGVTISIPTGRLKELITKDSIGLSNVDNTSDLDKPISKAVRDALSKIAAAGHKHTTADITDFIIEMNKKADKVHSHLVTDMTDFAQAIETKLDEMKLTVTMEVAEW